MSVKQRIAVIAMAAVLVLGIPTAAMAQTQDGLVNVMIGDVTILEEVDVALAANVIANVCAGVKLNALVLATGVDNSGSSVTCDQKGSGRVVAITDN